ncbi:MAG: hypothetical protein U0800_09165 [Isosphaeraceae bacterium]
MDLRTLGSLLRLAGPLLQLLCLTLILRPGTAAMSIAGQPVRSLLYLGFVLGFVLVIAGLILTMSKRKPSPKDRWDG